MRWARAASAAVAEVVVMRGLVPRILVWTGRISRVREWCVGRAVLECSQAEGIPLPWEIARDRVLTDEELARVRAEFRGTHRPSGTNMLYWST